MRKACRRLSHRLLGWVIAVVVMVWRLSCRRAIYNDPRPNLRRSKTPYVYALLHAHQAAAVMLNDERRLAAMVSRSIDGDLLVPSLRVLGVMPVRGSSHSKETAQDKGGAQALKRLAELNLEGMPVLLAVDGPRGPRGHVHRGVVTLAQANCAAVLPVIAWADHAWTLGRTWDRMMIPRFGSRLRLIFLTPLQPRLHEDVQEIRDRLASLLAQGEQQAKLGYFGDDL